MAEDDPTTRAERSLRERNAELHQYEYIVSASTDMLALLDPRFVYITANDEYLAAFGLQRDDVVGHTVAEVFGVPFFEQVIRPHAEVCLGGENVTYQDWFPFPAFDAPQYMEIRYSPYVDEGGSVQGFVVNGRNMTDYKKAEMELTRSNEELEQFAWAASHDLQEPLRMMSGYAGLLARKYASREDPDAEQYVAAIVDGAARMHRLISDLLTLSRLGKASEPNQPVALGSVLADVKRDLEVAIEESGAEIAHGELPTIPGDVTQLRQLFQNLIGSAIKFRGDAPPHVEVSATREGEEWVFVVRDNGIGFGPQYGEQIFETFRRLHPKDAYEGSGLGLTLCRRVVDRHGGRIWAESEAGPGAAFFFALPA
ncbi:MAG: PAS domain-containing protein [Proteobacteria bacterium]|nr:PAS domain-containing protein [Pseudomonadota bacterium]